MSDTPKPTRYNWRCALGFHPWAKWGAVTHHAMTMHAQCLGGLWMQLQEPITISEWRQERVCAACGKLQRREVKA